MVGLVMAFPPGGVAGDVVPSCAICGASTSPPYPECPHEGERMELALTQAMQRWDGWFSIREWVLNHARNQIMLTFRDSQFARRAQYEAELHALPCYTLFHKWAGNPPIDATQLHHLRAEMNHARARYQSRIDQDWRNVCLRYPEVLDYYFSLVGFNVPAQDDPTLTDPQFGGATALGDAREPRRLKTRRDSVAGEKMSIRRKEKRIGRGATPPPSAPLPGGYRRG